jgi:nicotinamidase-related amidase
LLNDSRSGRAIVILDMINDFAHVEGARYEVSTQDIIPFIQGEVQYFRERMRPVIFCNNSTGYGQGDNNVQDFGCQVIQALSPRNGEISIKKNRPNAFFKTDLVDILLSLKVGKLTIVGVFSHTSILMTAAAALDYGFDVVVPETCICADNAQDHIASLRLINRWLRSQYKVDNKL